MKNFGIITVAAAVLVTLAGCEGGSSQGEYTRDVLYLLEEKTGFDNLVTEYNWGENRLPAGEKQVLNGLTVYEDSDFEFDKENNVLTRIRTWYNNDGSVASRERRVAAYTYDLAQIYKYDVFLLGAGGSDTDPVEYWKKTLNYYGYTLNYESGDEDIITYKTDYTYGYGNSNDYVIKYNVTYSPRWPDPDVDDVPALPQTVTESYQDASFARLLSIETKSEDGTIVGLTKYTYKDGAPEEYRIYKNGDEETGTLVEKGDNYKAETILVDSYDVTKYDSNGENPVVTHVTVTRKTMTFKY